MPESFTQPREHFAGEEPALESYRAVSRSAIAALLLGIASPLVLVSPLLAMIPLAAVVAAVVALRSIAVSNGQLVGRKPAIVGLCMALFSLGWGLSWSLSRQAQVESQAQRFVDEWLAILAAGDHQRAHQLKLPLFDRADRAMSLDDFYKTKPEAAKDLQQFVSGPALNDFVTQGKGVAYQFDSLVAHVRQGTTDEIVLAYRYERPRKSPQRIWITVKRTVVEGSSPDWQIGSVDSFNPTAPT